MAASIDKTYKKACNNFLVVAMALEQEMEPPLKVVKVCKKFVKNNKKESGFSEEACSRLDVVWKSLDDELFAKADGIWIRSVFLPHLEERKTVLKLFVYKKVLK